MQAEEYTEKYTKANDRLQARNRAAKPRPIDHNDPETYEEIEYDGHKVRFGWLVPPVFLDEKHQQWIQVGSLPITVTPEHMYTCGGYNNVYTTLMPMCFDAVYDQLDRNVWSSQVARQLKAIDRSLNAKPMLVTTRDGIKLPWMRTASTARRSGKRVSARRPVCSSGTTHSQLQSPIRRTATSLYMICCRGGWALSTNTVS